MVVEQFGGCQAEEGVITHYKGITRAWGWPWWLCHSCWTRVCWRIALSWLGGWLGGRCTLQTRTVLCCGAVVIICSRFSTCSKSLLTTWIPGGTNVLIRCGLHKDSCAQLYIYQLDDQVLTLSGQGDQEENCCQETFLLHCSFDCLQKTWVPWESKSRNTSHLSLSTKRSRHPTNIDGDGGCHQVLGHPAHQTAHSETITRIMIKNIK